MPASKFPSEKQVVSTFRMSRSVLDRLDRQAQQLNISRSRLIAQGVESLVERLEAAATQEGSPTA